MENSDIYEVLKDNLFLIIGHESKESMNKYLGADYGIQECVEMAQNLAQVFKHHPIFTKEQIIGIIKYECFQCWHMATEEYVYNDIYNQIMRR